MKYRLFVWLHTNVAEFNEDNDVVIGIKLEKHESSTLDMEDMIPDPEYHAILNIDACSDGLYELIPINQSRDWETGIIDDWDLKLLPVEDIKNVNDGVE